MDVCRREFGLTLLAGLATRGYALTPRPKLLVLVLLEQMGADSLMPLEPRFGPGGFRRLMANGAFFPDCRHLASTFTATGLATVATGAWPSQHGIVADTWYDRGTRRPVRGVEEPLLATTLAAQIAVEPRTRVFVTALDRARAALVAGTGNASLFWTDDAGQFTAFDGGPPWLKDYNRRRPIENVHNADWMALGARPGTPPLRTLTFDPARPSEFLALYKASPLGEEAQFDFLGELIAREKLGQGDTFDFVCLLAGSSALLGYETGARSPLMEQTLLQLDRRLEYLLALLDKTPGAGNYGVALTAAHGAPPAPPDALRAGMAVAGETLAQSVDQALVAAASGRVEKYVYPFLYLDASGFRDPEPIRLAAARAAMQNAAVSGYLTAGGACSTVDDWRRRFTNSFHPRRSGDVMLSYRPEFIEDYGAGRGVSYGSLYNYDVRVPLFFYGPRFRAGTFEAPVESVDVAVTLARAIGVAAPSSSVGRVLGEALAG
jgi:hypothetical protein